MQKDDERYAMVEKTYRDMHTKQTMASVKERVGPRLEHGWYTKSA